MKYKILYTQKAIKDLQKKGEFIKITKAGFYESMVHNVDHIKKK